jgi:AAA domain
VPEEPIPYCVDLDTFLATVHDPVRWLVEDLIPREGLAVLAGAPKSLKTYLAQDLSVAIALGQPFLGRAVAPGPVVYVLEEGVRAGTAERYRRICARRGPTSDVHLIVRQKVRLDDRASLDQLYGQIERIHPVLVVLDPLIRLHGAQEDKSWQMQPVMSGIQDIIETCHTAIVLIHHTAKHAEGTASASVAARGSGVVTSSTDANLILTRRGTRGRLACDVRDAEGGVLEFSFDGDDGSFNLAAPSPTTSGEARLPGGIGASELHALAAAAIDGTPESGLTTRALAAALECSDETARRALLTAVASGNLVRVGPGNAPRFRPA